MNAYLKKHAFAKAIIQEPPVASLGIFVVVPVYNEPDLDQLLSSLINQKTPNCGVEILFVFNASENDSEIVIRQNEVLKARLDERLYNLNDDSKGIGDHDEVSRLNWIRAYTCAFNNLPKKHAGVGLARKIGMDEALRRFAAINKNGIIINTDADCSVAENYFFEIEQHFETNQKTNAASIYFEHPLKEDSNEYDAIILYELYLRYYINMQRLIGYPWAYQTIGSSMAVRAKAYAEQGGMNKRKAGEDFYLLQKHIELGNFSEINSTTVYASARESNRVPFGTGKAITEILENDLNYGFYNPQSFEQLHLFFSSVEQFYQLDEKGINEQIQKLPNELSEYLMLFDWANKIGQINKATSDFSSFKKRFFRDFNSFQLMKCLHWLRDNCFKNVNAEDAIAHLFDKLDFDYSASLKLNLLLLRSFDRTNKTEI